MNKRTLVLLLALALPLTARNDALASVKTVYVDSMGTSDVGARFRVLLGLELAKAGFTPVDTAEKADAIFTGVFVIRDYASVTLVLKAPDGKQLWGMDVKRWWVEGARHSDPAQRRAQDIARTLRKDVASAAKGK
jgi:hypothetical protein